MLINKNILQATLGRLGTVTFNNQILHPAPTNLKFGF